MRPNSASQTSTSDTVDSLRQRVNELEHELSTLRGELASLQAVVEHAPYAITLKDATGRYVFANEYAERYLHRPRKEIIGHTASDLWPPETAAALQAAEQSARTTHTPVARLISSHANGVFHSLHTLTFTIQLPASQPELICTITSSPMGSTFAQIDEIYLHSRLDGVLSTINGVVWSIDPHTSQLVYLSPSVETAWGRPVQDFFDQPALWYDIVHADDQEHFAACMSNLHTNRSGAIEYRIVRPDGLVRWVHLYWHCVRDNEGRLIGIDGICTNITDHKQMEAMLRDSEASYRLMANNATDMISRHMLDGVYLYASPASATLLGYMPVELIGRSCYDFIHPDDVRQVQDAQQHILNGSTTKVISYRIRHKDGHYIWFESTGQHVSNRETGELEEVIVVSRDMTQRKKIETELVYSLSLLRATIESAAEGILVVSKDGRIVSYNQQFEQLWELPKNWNTLPSQKERFQLLIERVSDPEQFTSRVEYLRESPKTKDCDTIFLKNGRILERTAIPYRVGQAIVGRVWSFRDVTDQRRAEAELQASQARLKAIFNHADVGIGLLNPDGGYIDMNNRWNEMFEVPREALLAQNYFDHLHPDDADISRSRLHMLVSGASDSYTLDSRFIRADKSIFWADVAVTAIYDEQQQLQAVLHILNDISGLKQLQQAERAALDLIQARAAELEHLKHVAETLNQAVTPHDALQAGLEAIAGLVDAPSGWLWMLTEADEVQLVATFNPPADIDVPIFTSQPFMHCTCIQQLLKDELIEPVHKIACERLKQSIHGMRGLTHHASIPIKVGRRLVGILNLAMPAQRSLSMAEIRVFQAVRDQFGVAMERARLFAQMNDTLAREQRLNDVTHTINSELDVQTVLQNIVRLAAELVGAEVGDMALLTQDKTWLSYPYSFNLPAAVRAVHQQQPPQTGLFRHVVDTGTSLLLENYSDHPNAIAQMTAAGVHAILIVPVVVGAERIGALGLYNMTPRRKFSQRDLALVESIGRQAGVAIQNAWRYEAELRSVQKLNTLRAMMTDVAAELELNKLALVILKHATTLLEATGGELSLYDDSRKDVYLAGSYNMGRDYTGHHQPVGKGAIGYVALHRQPLLIENYQEWEGEQFDYGDQPPYSIILVPLFIGRTLVGVIAIASTDPARTFSSEDVQLLSLFAQPATISIQNARHLADAQRRAEEAETLREAGAVVASSLNQTESIELILEQLELVVPYDSASVQLLRENYSEVVGGRGFDHPRNIIGIRLPLDDSNPGTQVYEQRQHQIVSDVQRAYPIFRRPPHTHIRSWLGVPLIFQNQLIGMLALDSTLPNHFTENHARLVTAFANHVAITLENARLFAEVQQLAITDPLTGLHNRRHFFELAYREVARTRRYRSPVAALMLDVDHFKKVNDRYGHAIGDQVLRAVAEWCQTNLRVVDIVGRYGGEEFVILLPTTDLKKAWVVAEHLRQQLAQTAIDTDSGTLYITASLGIASIEGGDTGTDLDKLLDRADQALLAAKKAGRNRVFVWENDREFGL